MLLSAFLYLSFPVAADMSKAEVNLLEHIFASYTSSVRPVSGHEDVVNVTFNMQLWNVLSIDEKQQLVTIYCEYSMHWRNEHLRWDPLKWQNVTILHVRPERLWIPDIILMNSADSNPHNIQKNTDIVDVNHNGDNVYQPKVVLASSFAADTQLFPFDSQSFDFMFESWSFTSDKLRIFKDNKQIVYDHYVNDSEWQLIKAVKNVTTMTYSNSTNAYTNIMFTYTFLRKPSYFIMTVILPVIVLVLIVVFSYFLPAASGERMGVMITVLLAFAVFLEMVAETLPRNSNSTSFLSAYILLTMCECALSFFLTCLVITLLHKGDDKGALPPPSCLRIFVRKHKKERNHSMFDIEAPQETYVHQGDHQEIYGDLSIRPSEHTELERRPPFRNSLDVNALREILSHVARITAQQECEIEEEKEKDDIQMEWARLAILADRVSFCLFLLATSSSLSILLVSYYNHHTKSII